ncbi:MAG TPA: DUF6022 family protein [Lysobacter sp.]|nr:DUF6022 family protein [Lysobacter sp.]
MIDAAPVLPSAATSDIRLLARFIQTTVDAGFSELYESCLDEYQQLFEQMEDMAYGRFNMMLFKPVRRAMDTHGLKAVPRLPGSFQTSREWGNADETHQQRWMTSRIVLPDGRALGTIAVGSHHDHSRFRMPRSPEIIAIEATGRRTVIDVLRDRMPEYGQAEDFRDWYARYLAGAGPH